MNSGIEFHFKNRDTESLYEIMTESHDWMLCLDAAEALARLGDKRGLEFLNDASESDDDEISEVAQEILDSPELRRITEERTARQRQERQAGLEDARKRLAAGKKVFRYKSIYLPSGYFLADESDEGATNVPALDDLGLKGWEVVTFQPHTASRALSGGLSGGHFLLKKEIAPNETAELDEL